MRSTRHIRSRVSMAALFGALGACQVGFETPLTGSIGCEVDSDCPPPLVCKETLGLCISPNTADSSPPGVVDARLPAEPASVGVRFEISFAASEPLLGAPQVFLVVGTSRLAASPAPADGERFVFTYTASGLEPTGVPVPVHADMVDQAGNEALGVGLGNVAFDFTAPTISEATAAPSRLGVDGSVTLSLRVSEALPSLPVVSFDGGRLFSGSAGADPLAFEFTYAATGLETPGPALVHIEVQDAAGNTAARDFADLVEVDFAAPELDAPAVVSRAVAREGQSVGVSFTMDEPLASPPSVAAQPVGAGAPVSLRFAERVGTTYTYSFDVLPTSVDGLYDLAAASAVDLAGNVGGPYALGSVTLDNSAPAFVSGPDVDRPVLSRELGSDTVIVSFVLDDVATAAEVFIGATVIGCDEAGSPPLVSYTCGYTVQPADSEGPRIVTVSVRDGAGNPAFAVAPSVSFDFSPPTLSLSVAPAGRQARAGELLTLTVVSSEPLDGAGVILDDDGVDFIGPIIDGERYTWNYNVGTTDSASFVLSATATDAAGNSTTAPTTLPAGMDGVAPGASSVSLSATKVSPGGTFALTFTASEALDADPIVTFSNGVDTPVGMDLDVANSSGLAFEFDGTAPISGGAINYAVTIALRDVAGNQAAVAAGTVEIDTVAPQVVGLDISPSSAKLGDVVRVVLTANEPMVSAPSLVVQGPAGTVPLATDDAATPGNESRINYVYVLSITGALDEGDYVVQPFTLADIAGNDDLYDPGVTATFAVDTTVPVVDNADASPDQARDGTVLRVVFDVSEALSSPPVVTLGSRDLAPAAAPNPSFDYTYELNIDDGLDAEGLQTIVIAVADDAGNVAFGSAAATLDYTGPNLAGAASVSPATARSGATVTVSLTVNEPLGATPTLSVTESAPGNPLSMGSPVVSGQNYTWSGTVSGSTAETTHTFTVAMTDLAGNPRTGVAAGSVLVDRTAPSISSPSVTSTTLAPGGTLTATFTASETLGATPTVTASGLSMTLQSQVGNVYTFVRTVLVADGDGVKTVRAELRDAAGNTATVTVGTGTFDVSPPQVAGATLSRDPAFAPAIDTALDRLYVAATDAHTNAPVTVTLTVFANENVQSATLTVVGGTLSFGAATINNKVVTFSYPVNAAHAQTTYSFRVSWSDALGNTTSTPINLGPTLVLDFAAPATSGIDQTRLLFRRIPWGAQETAGVPSLALSGSAGAVSGAERIIAYRSTTASPATEAGWAQLSGGAFTISALSGGDVADLYVALVDRAGARSATVLVENTEWVASLAGKVAGSTIENPHGMVAVRSFEPMLDQEERIELDPTAITALSATGGTVVSTSGRMRWRPLSGGATSPAGRSRYGLAYDSGRDRLVVFAGQHVGGSRIGDTWEWDGSRWSNVCGGTSTCSGPPDLDSHAMAYDARRARTVVFGGVSGATGAQTDQLWEWDGSSWALLCGSGTTCSGPSARTGHTLAYDPRRGSVVLVGGGMVDNTMWEWDGVSWTRICGDGTACTAPSTRTNTALAFDPGSQTLVLFGGTSGSFLFSDTWEWNGSSWTQRCGSPLAACGPPARAYHALAYDGAEVMMFGGGIAFSSAGAMADGWSWDGAVWTQRCGTPLAACLPVKRQAHSMAYDPNRDQVLLFGGANQDGGALHPGSSLAAWDGLGWRLECPHTGCVQPNDNQSRLVYDQARGETVLFESSTGDTWGWDGSGWRLACDYPACPGPGTQTYVALADDVANQRVVFLGYDGITYEWDGATWTPGTDGPPVQGGGHIYYDTVANEVHFFAPTALYRRSGGTWSTVCTSGGNPSCILPTGSNFAISLFTFDVLRGRPFIVGSINPPVSNDTSTTSVEWNGSAWVELCGGSTTACALTTRYDSPITYSLDRGRAALFGGYGQLFSDEVWEWDQSTWFKRCGGTTDCDSGPGRVGAAMIYDGGRGRYVLRGSATGRDLWEGQLPLSAPAHLTTWSYGAAGGPPSRACLYGACRIDSLEVRWTVGGLGDSAGTPVTGASLMGWSHGAWVELLPTGAHTATTASPAQLTYTTSVPATLGGLLYRGNELRLAVKPRAPNGRSAALASIASDYVEVRIRYRNQ